VKYVYNKSTKELKELGKAPHTGAFDEYYLSADHLLLKTVFDDINYIRRLESSLHFFMRHYFTTGEHAGDDLTKVEQNIKFELNKLNEFKD